MDPGTVSVFMVFGMPVAIVFISKYFKFREKELALRERQGEPRLLAASDKEKKQLEARIQNLESIVCSVDFELNQKLNRLIGQSQGGFKALPAPAGEVTGEGATQLAAQQPGQLSVGKRVLGRYMIERELGRGGMGAVYLAQDDKLGERVALKTISALLAGDPQALREAMRREVQAARRVTHPNVIRIHDLHEDGPLLCLSMEYIDGETLFDQVKRRGPLPVREALDLLCAVSAGVAAAHQAGVIHRDLKPQNILLGGLGGQRTVKIIDFGVARASFLAGMTATGMLMGTPEYMAPEQIRGGAVDARTDVYALGAVAYFALCGRPPFTGETPIAIGFAQLQEPPRPPRALRPEVPPDLEAAMLRALSKDPAERFPDAVAWGKALAAML
jgi:eukaryotic-like serine/threonine-protein kinase